jgi:hypothetical protein
MLRRSKIDPRSRMIETASRPAATPTPFRPEPMIGAMSPFWGYFAGAAIAGAAWWWMTRWMRPHDIGFPAAAVPEPAPFAPASSEEPALPVGGEAAPISPAMLSAAADPEVREEPSAAPPRKRRKSQPKSH